MARKELRIQNLTKNEYAELEHIVAEFQKEKGIRFKRSAYLELIRLGSTKSKSEEKVDQQLILKEINNRLKVIEPELRLLFFGIFGDKKETLKKLNNKDISNIPLLDSIKNSLK